MKLEKRQHRFPLDERKVAKKLNGYTLPQRSHEKLPADAKPKHGVPQEMPSREN